MSQSSFFSASGDGYRVLVLTLIWPRGLHDARARIDEWPYEEVARRRSCEPDTDTTRRGSKSSNGDTVPSPPPPNERPHCPIWLRSSATVGPVGVTILTATKRYDISHAAVLASLLNPTETADDA